MNPPSRMDKMISGLLPLESYRSPWVATKRLGQDALVAISSPISRASDVAVAPSYWFAVSPDFSSLLTFTSTPFQTSVEDFQPTPVEQHTSLLTPRDAHALLWRLSESMWPDFFAGRPAADGTQEDVTRAIDSTVPARLQPWLTQCCSDFFEWIRPTAEANFRFG